MKISRSLPVLLALSALPLAIFGQTADNVPPRLTAFSFSPATIDASSGPATVTVSFAAADDVSGLDFVRVDFTSSQTTNMPMTRLADLLAPFWCSIRRPARTASWAAWLCPIWNASGSFDHRAELEGQAVAKFEAREITEAGSVRAGVFTGLHQAKGSELALQTIGEHQLA